jgi:hypothetical protein
MPSQHAEPQRGHRAVVLLATAFATTMAVVASLATHQAEASTALLPAVGLLSVAAVVAVLLVTSGTSGRHRLSNPEVHPALSELSQVVTGAIVVAIPLYDLSAGGWRQWAALVLPAAAGVILAQVAHVALHETGHLTAARAVGAPWEMIAIGPAVVRRRETGVHVTWSRFSPLSGGFVIVHQRHTVLDWRRMIAFTLGGTVVSLILACVGVALALAAWRHDTLPSSLRALALAFGGVMAMDAGSTVVLTAFAVSTDGQLIADALRRRYPAEPAQHPIHPREMPLVDALDDEPSIDRVACGLYAAITRNEQRTAAAARDRLIALAPKQLAAFRGELMYEAAFATALLDGDDGAARTLLDQAPRYGLQNPVVRARAEAAVLIAEGDREGAIAAAERGLAAYGDDSRDVFWERDWLVELRRDAQGERSDFTPWFERHRTAAR